MIEGISGLNWGAVAAIYLGLLLFGIGFNLFTAWTERRGYIQGYTSLLVALGVLVTVGSMALISPRFALLTTGAFVMSGTPMIVGSIWRHVREREHELERLRQEAKRENGCGD